MIPANKFLNLSPDQITSMAEEEFFTSLRLRNGTYKTTYQKRFAGIDSELQELFSSSGIHVDSVLDIAISSGSSTLELYEELRSNGCESQVVGTDLMVDAYLVHVFPGCFALVDETGYPLRYDIFKWSMKPWVINRDYWNGFFVFRKCVNLVLGYRAKRMISIPGSVGVETVTLVTPKLHGYIDISIEKDDVTQYNHNFEGRFNFIRAANILNKGYFGRAELMSAVTNIRRYLAEPKAALLIVRTHQDGKNHGSLFVVDSDKGCRVLRRFGQGSEIEDVVLDCMRNA